jgi:hypothetical protein
MNMDAIPLLIPTGFLIITPLFVPVFGGNQVLDIDQEISETLAEEHS